MPSSHAAAAMSSLLYIPSQILHIFSNSHQVIIRATARPYVLRPQ